MELFPTITEIEYPESDGKPMGETDLHIQWMMRIHQWMTHRYRGQRVYIACDLLVYYTEGLPRHFVVPDNFIVFDHEPGLRRTYKIWEERKPPEVVFEVTSRGTRREDRVEKPRLYADIGVQELYLYDPLGEYLRPALQAFERSGDELVRVDADASGAFYSPKLDAALRLSGNNLVIVDRATGQPWLTEAEEAVSQLREKDAALAAAEEEIRRLRERLRLTEGNGDA